MYLTIISLFYFFNYLLMYHVYVLLSFCYLPIFLSTKYLSFYPSAFFYFHKSKTTHLNPPPFYLFLAEAPRSGVVGQSQGGIGGGGQNLEELKEGGGDPNGEPDTMLNLRKTFAGIFGDMRS